MDNAVPLPVKLINFDALCENDATVLKWTTASENNNDFFSIEKSTDGINFYEIGVVKGSGNSSNIINYSFEDNYRNNPIKYYRLVQVDYDGQKEYTNVISSTCSSIQDLVVEDVYFGDNSLQFSLYTTNDDKLNISLYDYMGKKVEHKETTVKAGDNNITISELYLTSSIYILHIQGKDQRFTSKLFKQ